MSDEDWGFALPAFKPEDALQRLRRDLRALGLTEREGRFERRGSAIARAAVDGAVLTVAIVKRPSRTSPEWMTKALKESAQVRDFVALVKKNLAGWSDSDE
ncbi:hypothetical protein KAK07_14195 [Ideonella sp. 4Y16]|uniref:Uncharacterized protein n=1 Tax=Ideonella alba TaxID=2824118 RepID=A0A940Y973_9BURK|nr:hypothetical protein [Ideonella alba]MBQ0932334.1 hypothetical protein [Ideonella alba]MBQ0944484.1 hypothetical protein [Ideonella alba]